VTPISQTPAQTVLITGGSKGIGRAVAESFAAAGATVVVGYHRDRAAAERTCQGLLKVGGRGIPAAGDIGSEDGVRALVQTASAAVDGFDAIVHCAVRAVPGDLLTAKAAELSPAVAANGLSILWLAQQALPLLRRGSSIVFLSSQGARSMIPGYGLIGPPKAFAESLACYLAVELAVHGIRVNVVESGPVDTESFRSAVGVADQVLKSTSRRTPAGRGVTVADVGAVVLQVCSPGFSMVTGQRIVVDGGLTLLA